jgi:hypothetical protein
MEGKKRKPGPKRLPVHGSVSWKKVVIILILNAGEESNFYVERLILIMNG